MGGNLSLPGGGQSRARFNHFSPLVNGDEEVELKIEVCSLFSPVADNEWVSLGELGEVLFREVDVSLSIIRRVARPACSLECGIIIFLDSEVEPYLNIFGYCDALLSRKNGSARWYWYYLIIFCPLNGTKGTKRTSRCVEEDLKLQTDITNSTKLLLSE